MRQKFITELENLRELIQNKPKDEPKKKTSSYDFGMQKSDLYKKNIENSIERIKELAFDLASSYKDDKNNKDTILSILMIIQKDFNGEIDKLISLADSLNIRDMQKQLKITLPNNIPTEIRPDIIADLNELERAFNSGCFRASTILCGRILETCLHRKYYEATGNDILEKNPGIGLGKLIARLSDKNVKFDPGLTQQIHLINHVRIHTVHVKKESFSPSPQQTYAMILYTLDIIDKMF